MEGKISVIVPVFNLEKEIDHTVESIIDQTYDDIEIILVDDGSTDTSGERIDSIARLDKRIKTIHKENGGVSSARLAGVRASKGEWIGFVDGDDYIEPYMYKKLMENALDHDADISHCGYQMVFPDRIDKYYGTGRIVHQKNEKGLKDLLEGNFVEPGLWNKLFRRALFDHLLNENTMDLSIKNNEDLLMNYYLFKESKGSIYEDICPYHYVIRKESAAMSGISAQKLGDPIKVLETIRGDIDSDNALYGIVIKRLGLLLINGATMPENTGNDIVDEHIERCRSYLKDERKLFMECSGDNTFRMKYLLFALSPELYRGLHSTFVRITKRDEKYRINRNE